MPSLKNCSFSLERSVSICFICFFFVSGSEVGAASERFGVGKRTRERNIRRLRMQHKHTRLNALMVCEFSDPKIMIPSKFGQPWVWWIGSYIKKPAYGDKTPYQP